MSHTIFIRLLALLIGWMLLPALSAEITPFSGGQGLQGQRVAAEESREIHWNDNLGYLSLPSGVPAGLV